MTKGISPQNETREKRLAEALRENLRRRKAQTRDTAETHKTDEEPKD